MKVLIIGASGMLAKPVIQHLDNAGFQLRLFSRTVNQSMFDKEYEIVQGDVFNTDDLDRATSRCDTIMGNSARVTTSPFGRVSNADYSFCLITSISISHNSCFRSNPYWLRKDLNLSMSFSLA